MKQIKLLIAEAEVDIGGPETKLELSPHHTSKWDVYDDAGWQNTEDSERYRVEQELAAAKPKKKRGYLNSLKEKET